MELRNVTGTGENGRIVRADVENYKPGTGSGAPALAPGKEAYQDEPLSQMRKTIAKRLSQSIGPIPTFYLTIECDMTRMMELRERANRALEKEGAIGRLHEELRLIAGRLVFGDGSTEAGGRPDTPNSGFSVENDSGVVLSRSNTPSVRLRKRIGTTSSEVTSSWRGR